MSRCCGCASAVTFTTGCSPLGSEHDQDVIESLELLYAGALVRAGMGYGSYADIADRLEKSARLMLS